MRNKFNKRKEAASRAEKKRPPKRINKDERDKGVFKRRKFNKNNFVEEGPVVEESSSEDEVVETGYGQLLQVFASSAKEKSAIDSESGESSEEEEIVDEMEIKDIVSENESDDAVNDDEDSELGEEEVDAEEESDADEKGDAEEGDIDEEELENQGVDVEEESDEEEEIGDEGDKLDAIEDTETGDPFAAHFETELEPELVTSLNEKNRWKVSDSTFPELGNLQVQNLNYEPQKAEVKTLMVLEPESKLLQVQKKLMSAQPVLRQLHELHLKQKLLANIPEELTPYQSEVLSVLSSYKDLLYTERTNAKGEELRMAYTIHALNHILKTRTKILNNNAKHDAREESDEKLRDQGFTRPKILIIVPFKESCRKIVEMMISLLFPNQKGGVANRKRFNEDYAKIETARKDKPDDYYDTFQGNIDDSFKLGIGVTKKTLKLYTDFYSSDIIISSPLGLRMITGVEGEDKKTDTDFLSSIELLVVDQAEVVMMQNWDHVATVMNQMHSQPKDSHGVDYSRVRLWSLDGQAKFYRQTVLLSGIPAPEINNIWNKSCVNYMGKVKVMNEVVGEMGRVVCDTPVVWHRVDCAGVKESLEERFKYFTEKIMPQFKRDAMDHTLVFVPSYFDFVKVRNWFKFSDFDYSEVSEYTRDKKIAQARDEFYHNEKHFLLYTERSHFYRRFRLKGIRHLIFYQPPTFGWMYSELCNLLLPTYQNPRGGSENNMSITVIYTKYDLHRLSLCVGSETSSTMLSSEKSVHMFKPGEA